MCTKLNPEIILKCGSGRGHPNSGTFEPRQPNPQVPVHDLQVPTCQEINRRLSLFLQEMVVLGGRPGFNDEYEWGQSTSFTPVPKKERN